jgi:flagellar biosynthesis GTPase FlhF
LLDLWPNYDIQRRVERGAPIAKIFINYRRGDSDATAGRLHDALGSAFGFENLFMDIDAIPTGVDFVEFLAKQVAACDFFIAVIGPDWLDARDEKTGIRRLQNPNDYVGIEIAAALKRNIPVAPVLVDGARFPLADQLPDSIKPLVRRHAAELRNAQFRRDVQALTDEIRRAINSKQGWLVRGALAGFGLLHRRWGVVTAGALVGLFSGLITFYYLSSPVIVDTDKATTEKAAADAKARAEKAAVEKAAAVKNAEEKAAAEKVAIKKADEAKADADAAAKKAAVEKDAGQKDAADRAAKAAADKAAREKVAADKAAAEKDAAEKAAAEKAAAEQKAAAESAAAERRSQALRKFTTRKNRDILKNDIAINGAIGTSQPDIGACAAQCDDTPACRAFSFDHVMSKCYLKSNVATSVTDATSTIAVKLPLQLPSASNAPQEIQSKRDTRIINTDPPSSSSRKKVSSLNSCKSFCLDSMTCVAFTFLKNTPNENCEMFGGLKGFLNDTSAESGYKRQSR